MGLESFVESKKNKLDFLRKYHNYIEAIRHQRVPDKTTLKNQTGVAWPTLDKALIDFKKNNSAIFFNDDGFSLKNEFSIHAGISVGATQIKLFICDFSYKALTKDFYEKNNLMTCLKQLQIDDIRYKNQKDKFDWNYFCFDREDSIEGIILRIKMIIEALLEIDSITFNVLSIGISFPGIINPDNLRIDFSPNIKCLRNIVVSDLISKDLLNKLLDRKISISFEHDTQAASIYEIEQLISNKNKKLDNVCCVYVAAGIGASFISNNRLCRGTTNSFGELGHTPAPELLIEKTPDNALSKLELEDKKSYNYNSNKNNSNTMNSNDRKQISCECGKLACLESAFRRNVFDSYTIDDYLEKINAENELLKFYQNHPYRYRVLKEYIGYIVGLIINFLNPDIIVFSGRIMWEIPELENDFNTIKAKSAIGIPAQKCEMVLGSKDIFSAAAGTAISSLHCSIAGTSFCNIKW